MRHGVGPPGPGSWRERPDFLGDRTEKWIDEVGAARQVGRASSEAPVARSFAPIEALRNGDYDMAISAVGKPSRTKPAFTRFLLLTATALLATQLLCGVASAERCSRELQSNVCLEANPVCPPA